LKILPSEMAANQDRMRRFKQEATAAAALNHPNIAHIYEIGESEGTNFIAMEFVEGVTLREQIHREHTELRKLLRYLQHVAEGLAKAHAAGIVHRDLKPDNIMVTREGHAKILDFGLAKLIEPQISAGIDKASSGEDATAILQQQSTPGLIMGTVGYMSPEQAQGRTNEIDQRSDIFSFGCILFEAATGKKPFEGDSIVKSLHSLIYEPAPQIKDLNPSAPAELQRIYVDREWHGRGVGDALLQACFSQTRAWHCDVVWLGVWERNPRATAFYERHGFRRVGRQVFLLGRDEQFDNVMARSVT